MLNRKKILAGLLLTILAIVLYAVLHDFTELYLFRNLESGTLIHIYKKFQSAAVFFLRKLPFFFIINNYVVDFLWFLSFSLIFTELFSASKKIKFCLLIFMALLSEFSQLFFPNLGTFDIFDLLIYFVVAGGVLRFLA